MEPPPAAARMPPLLSVVFSFRNEEDVLPELLHRLRAVLGDERAQGHIRGHELVFVNDVSTDRSVPILMEAARDHDDIRLINMARNFGIAPCFVAGMEHSRGDVVVYMDADLQDPPEVISDLLRAWREDGYPDVVHTIRRSRAGEGRLKMAITWIGYWVLYNVSSVPIRIEAGDFKLISRRALNELLRLREKNPFLRGLVAWVGFKQTEIYYDRHARAAGATKFPVLSRRVIGNFLDSALISFSDTPLKCAMVVGAMVSTLAFVMLIYVVAQRLFWNVTSGWSAIMVAILFLGGMQMLFLGVMGLYLNAIFLETKGRPNYIIESKFGFPEDKEESP